MSKAVAAEDPTASGALQARRFALVGQLASGIAHEINTPAQYIGDNLRFLHEAFEQITRRLSDVMDATARDPELEYLLAEVPAAIAQSLDGTGHIAQVTRAVRSFSVSDAGARRAVDVNAAIEDALTLARTEWKSIVPPRRELDPMLPAVTCAEVELKGVLLELIVGAARAMNACRSARMSDTGGIVVASRSTGGRAEVVITDTAMPLDAPERQAILARARRVLIAVLQGELHAWTCTDGTNTVVVHLPLDGCASHGSGVP